MRHTHSGEKRAKIHRPPILGWQRLDDIRQTFPEMAGARAREAWWFEVSFHFELYRCWRRNRPTNRATTRISKYQMGKKTPHRGMLGSLSFCMLSTQVQKIVEKTKAYSSCFRTIDRITSVYPSFYTCKLRRNEKSINREEGQENKRREVRLLHKWQSEW